MRKLALVLVVVAVATIGIPSVAPAAPPASTPNTTYRIHGTAVTTPVVAGVCPDPLPPGPPPVVPITVSVSGTGVMSRLGAVSVAVAETGLGICVGAPVPVPVKVLTAASTYAAQNGDKLVTTMVSSTDVMPVPGGLFGFTAVDQLTGGSGRMAGASGSMEATVTFDPSANPVSAQLSFTGTITLPKH